MEKLREEIKKQLNSIDATLYHLEWKKQFGTKILRVIVNTTNQAIDMEFIIKISKHLSKYLDENEPISNDYSLEVLSAGIERELYTLDHWKASLDKIVYVVLKKPINNVKWLFAKVIEIQGKEIILEINDKKKKQYTIKLNEIKKANWAYKESKNVR